MAASLLRRARTVSPYLLAGLLTGAGVLHFLAPGPYADIVPPALPGDPRTYVLLSGVAEVACGVLVAVPRTRRGGALAALVLFVAVFPANVQMALDSSDASTAAQVVAWGRLPLQVPLVLWAWQVARDAPGTGDAARTG